MTRFSAFLVVAMLLLLATEAPRQVLAQATLELGELGMDQELELRQSPRFGRWTFDPAMRPRELDHGQPGIFQPSQVPDLGQRIGEIYWPVAPVVGATRVGFLNTTDAPVRFTVNAGAQASVYQLTGREILTVEVPNGATLTGTVSTGSEDASLNLDRGAIYLLKPENDRWIFSRL